MAIFGSNPSQPEPGSGLGSDLRFGPGSSSFETPAFAPVNTSGQPPPSGAPTPPPLPAPVKKRGFRTYYMYFRLALFAIFLLIAAYRHFAGKDSVNGPWITAGGSLQQNASGLIFDNPTQQVHFTAPAGWVKFDEENALAAVKTDGCNDMLLEKEATGDLQEMNDEMFKVMQKDHPDIVRTVSSGMLAGRSAATFHVDWKRKDGDTAHQQMYRVRRGKNIFLMIETTIGDSPCAEELAQIRSSLTL